jgi:ABC-type oligopeptide transport system substrate-binding subunit
MVGYDASDTAQSYDPAAAKKLLSGADVTADTLNKFKLLTRNTNTDKAINQLIVDQWNTNFGLNLQLDLIDTKTITRTLRRGQFDIYGLDGWGADYPDQQNWFDLFTSGSCRSLNWGCPTLPGYDDLVKTANTGLDESQRNKDYLTLQKMLIDSAAVAFVSQEYEYDLIAPYLHITNTAFDDPRLPGSLNYHAAYVTTH